MATYLVADEIPYDVPYLTAGKRYKVIGEYGGLCVIEDDNGDRIDTRPVGCAFLDGRQWRVVVDD